MAVSMSPKQKVYLSVLDVVRNFIKENHLKAGDKLPSERELAGKLQASRSSIREALRSLELLGLIEVRHGEGTFISTYRPFHTVELLASFILLESNTKRELIFVKRLLEKEGAKLAFEHLDESDYRELESIINCKRKSLSEKHIAFFYYIFNKLNNLLLIKIWGLVQEFSQTIHSSPYEDSFYDSLIKIYKNREYSAIEDLFHISKLHIKE